MKIMVTVIRSLPGIVAAATLAFVAFLMSIAADDPLRNFSGDREVPPCRRSIFIPASRRASGRCDRSRCRELWRCRSAEYFLAAKLREVGTVEVACYPVTALPAVIRQPVPGCSHSRVRMVACKATFWPAVIIRSRARHSK